jgi:hypothetical protein
MGALPYGVNSATDIGHCHLLVAQGGSSPDDPRLAVADTARQGFPRSWDAGTTVT